MKVHLCWLLTLILAVPAAATACSGQVTIGTVAPASSPGFSSPDEGFTAISGTSDQDVWALGLRKGSPSWAFRHWDGTSWASVAAPDGVTGMPTAVWARAVDDAWAVGNLTGVALHWQGTSWVATDTSSFLAPGTGQKQPGCTNTYDNPDCRAGETDLWSVWSAAADDVWAVGGSSAKLPQSGVLVVHYDGKTWTRFPVDARDGLLRVWGFASNDVWAVGASGVAIHWDGAHWSSVDGATDLYRFGLWGAASNDVWAVGNGGGITRFDGHLWSPFADEGYAEYRAIAGSASNNVWAVGKFTPTATDPATLDRLVGHWDGAKWSTCKTSGAPTLSDVWVSKTGRVWVAGGAIEEISQTAWAHCAP